MEIASKWDHGDDQAMRVHSITITLDPEDDPDGHINGLISRGRLEAFLRVYARPLESGGAQDSADARDLLLRFGFVASMCASRMEGLQLAARDQWGMGWGTIANAVERSRSTVKGQVRNARARYAESGAWFDGNGLHRGTPEQATAAGELAHDRDGEDQDR